MAVVNWKKAEDGKGFILRLWNMSDREESARISFPGLGNISAVATSVCEEDILGSLPEGGNELALRIAPRDMITVRINMNDER